MSFKIRKLGIDDVEFTKQLILYFLIDDGVENPTAPSDDYIRQMLSKPDFHVVVALEDENVIGGLTAYELPMFKREVTEMFLYEIGVKDAYRQQGIATALIEYLKEICVHKGLIQMFVGTSKDNIEARGLYAKTGGKADEDTVWFDYIFD